MTTQEMGLAFAIGLGSIWADTVLRIAFHLLAEQRHRGMCSKARKSHRKPSTRKVGN